jgi:uncharacterized membrane protein
MLWPAGALALIVLGVMAADRHPAAQRVLRWIPLPLWCYALPAALVAAGWLPAQHPAYRAITDRVLPVALALLLCGVDLPAATRSGARALLAAAAGAVGIVIGAPLGVWLWHAALPPDAWKGAGALAGTWTGGTMNLLALRTILDAPNDMFAALIIVDAVMAYGWMAVLVAAATWQAPLNRWLGASGATERPAEPFSASAAEPFGWRAAAGNALLAVALAAGASLAAPALPTSALVSSTTGWTLLLVTTAALGVSFIPSVRRAGSHSGTLGYPCLYLVLAATGAQASLSALRSSSVWLLVGVVAVCVHGVLLAGVGRMARIPLGVLATASQANIGGLVSAPLVGAVYHRALAPVGLVLALAGNALGTYLGMLAASVARALG